MQPHTSYLICGTPRSGSSLLCEALINTGIAGQPEEYFQPQNERTWQERWGSSTYTDYLARVIEQCTSPNGVFGAKMMWGYFDNFAQKIRQTHTNQALALPDLMQSIFPNLHYIWIKRNDKVRQAISQAKAVQTNQWKLVTETNPLLTVRPRFSFNQIDFIVQQFEAEEAAWAHYFAANAIQPFIVVYEDFVQQYEETAIKILEYLTIAGIENLEFAPRKMHKQADEESERWIQRYYSLKAKSGVHRLVSHTNGLLLSFFISTRAGQFLYKRRMFSRKPTSENRAKTPHGLVKV